MLHMVRKTELDSLFVCTVPSDYDQSGHPGFCGHMVGYGIIAYLDFEFSC